MTTLHLMLAFTLCGLGAGSIVLYWFTSVSPNFKEAYRPFMVFGICSFLFGLGIAAVSVFYKNWLMQGKRSFLLRICEIGMLTTGSVLYRFAGQNIPSTIFGLVAGLIAIAAIWESRKPGNPSAIINEEGVLISNGQIRKRIPWDEIESVLLRHGILTIEMSENRLLQRSLSGPVDIETIEAFGKAQILLHEKKRLAKTAW